MDVLQEAREKCLWELAPGARFLWAIGLGPLEEGVFWGVSLWDTFLGPPPLGELPPAADTDALWMKVKYVFLQVRKKMDLLND